MATKEYEYNEVNRRYQEYVVTELTSKFRELAPEQWEAEIIADLPFIEAVGDQLVEVSKSLTSVARSSVILNNTVGEAATNIQQELLELILAFATNIIHYVARRREVAREVQQAWLEMGLKASQALRNERGEALFRNSLGLLYSVIGEHSQALEYFSQALSIYRYLSDKGGEATTLNNTGRVYSALGDRTRALEYYNQALTLSRMVVDRGGEATTLNNIGSVYYALGDRIRALEYYNQSLPPTRAVRDRGGEAKTLNNIGRVYSVLGDRTRALEYYNQALVLSRAVRDVGSEAQILAGIGNIYSALGDRTRALEYYQQAMPLSRVVGDIGNEAHILIGIGSVYSDLGETDKALEYYSVVESLKGKPEIGDKSNQKSQTDFILEPTELAQLCQYLKTRFNLKELHNLAFDSGINYQELPHDNILNFDHALALLAHVTRIRQIEALLKLALTKRPDPTLRSIYQRLSVVSATPNGDSLASPNSADTNANTTNNSSSNGSPVYNISGDYINNTKTTIQTKTGDVTMGDRIEVRHSQNVNIKNTRAKIENSIKNVGASPHGSADTKAKFTALTEQLQSELAKVPDNHSEEAETVAERLVALIKEVGKSKLDKEEVQDRGNSLVRAAKNLEGALPTVFSIATQIAAHLNGFF
jgi:tetratricopeptide (TPR) repeat protein